MNLKDHIRSIKDYPKKGILFRDITTLIKNETAFVKCVDEVVENLKNLNSIKLQQLKLEVLFLLQQCLMF